MSWIAVDLDHTLLNPETKQAEPGAREAMRQLLEEGHRVTIWTARFSANPEDKRRIQDQVEQELADAWIPWSDIWTEHNKPNVDAFIGDNLVPYRGDWGKSLADLYMMLKPQEEGTDGQDEGKA